MKLKFLFNCTLISAALVFFPETKLHSSERQSVTDFPLVFNEESTALFGDKAVAQGYDVVAYFDGTPTEGREEFSTEYENGTFWFSSIENQKKFLANPSKYLPAYGGYCAYAMAQGYLAPIDPEAWTVYQGKLYLNYNLSVRSKWAADKDNMIQKADANWPQIKQTTRKFTDPATPGGVFY